MSVLNHVVRKVAVENNREVANVISRRQDDPSPSSGSFTFGVLLCQKAFDVKPEDLRLFSMQCSLRRRSVIGVKRSAQILSNSTAM